MNPELMQEIPRPIGYFHAEWIFLLAFGTLVLLAYTRRYFGARLFRHWQAFWNFRLAMQLMREDATKGTISLAYGCVSAAIISLSIYAGVNNLKQAFWPGSVPYPWLASFAVAAVSTWLRPLWISLIQLVSGGITGLQEYSYCSRVSFLVLGVLLLLPSVVAVYCPPDLMFYSALLIFVLMGITQILIWVRGMQVAIFHHIPLYYLFFYICTLEILPAALVVKFFNG
jgi:hypothetical protein